MQPLNFSFFPAVPKKLWIYTWKERRAWKNSVTGGSIWLDSIDLLTIPMLFSMLHDATNR